MTSESVLLGCSPIEDFSPSILFTPRQHKCEQHLFQTVHSPLGGSFARGQAFDFLPADCCVGLLPSPVARDSIHLQLERFEVIVDFVQEMLRDLALFGRVFGLLHQFIKTLIQVKKRPQHLHGIRQT